MPSTPSPTNLPPDDLLEDLRKVAESITGDPTNLEKLTQQLKQISASNQNLVKLIESQMVTQKPIVESNKPESNPLAVVQSQINALFESMRQVLVNMRTFFQQVPIPDNDNLNPLKALQSLESQFQSMINRFRINNPLAGTGANGGQKDDEKNVLSSEDKKRSL